MPVNFDKIFQWPVSKNLAGSQKEINCAGIESSQKEERKNKRSVTGSTNQ